VSVYPNPASDLVFVTLPNVHPFTSIEVYNATGQKITTQSIFQRVIELNTSNYANGSYFIHFIGENASQHAAIIISK
jgi:hypothetical protein